MIHEDHVNFLHKGVPGPGGIWADLGSGRGAFTLALADLIGPGTIYSIDKDRGSLREQERVMQARFPGTDVRYIAADMSTRIDLPLLDGVVMANSLHYLREKNVTLQLVRSYLKPEGRLILVEYNADRGNWAVPYPLSYNTWEKVARQNGFSETRLLMTRPSRFLNEMYSASSIKQV